MYLKNNLIAWQSFKLRCRQLQAVMQQFQIILHKSNLTDLIQDGSFRGCSRTAESQKDLIPKTSHTYPTMMKLSTVIPYLKKTQKYINHVTHHRSSAEINIFSPGISKSCYIKKYRLYISFWYIISNSFNFFWQNKVFFW